MPNYFKANLHCQVQGVKINDSNNNDDDDDDDNSDNNFL